MKYLNFILGSVSWIPYFIPLVIEGNKRNLNSYFFLRKNPKEYADPFNKNNINRVRLIAKKYNIQLKDIKDVINYPGLTFMLESDISGRSEKDYVSSGVLYLNSTHLKVSFTFNADFIWQYGKYKKIIDYMVFPGETYALTYQKGPSEKFLYLGSPKFDVTYDTEQIYKKYNLPTNQQYVLFFYPKGKWISMSSKLHNPIEKMKYLINLFRKIGYKVIVKSREKDHITSNIGDYYFEEQSIFPISSLELLHISKLAVYFSSATIEECVMMSTPFIDFKVDYKFDRFAFLHHPAYSRIIGSLSISFDDLYKHVKEITKDNKEIFKQMQEKHMFVNENVSGKILDYFEKESDTKCEHAQIIYTKIKELKIMQNKIDQKHTSNVVPILKQIDENSKIELDK